MAELPQEFSVNTHDETDEYMPNAYPPRKLFSSRKVSDAQHTEDDKDGTMRTVKAVKKVIDADGKLVTPDK